MVQLIQDYEDYAEVNKQLEKMGYNIGTRLIEDFLARSSLGRCSDFREVGEVMAKVRALMPMVQTDTKVVTQVGFKSFLNITPGVTHAAPASRPNSLSQQSSLPNSAFILTFDENPLAEFVELPEEALEGGLWFSNVLCGVIRGALEMVCMDVRSSVQMSNTSSCCRYKCRYKQNFCPTFYGAMRVPKYALRC